MAMTYLDTPLGRLTFHADYVGGAVTDFQLAQRAITPDLPAGMSVSACVAVLLEFSVMENVGVFQFHGEWGNFEGKGYGETGEGLDAWAWEQDGHVVMVGTEDADLLNARMPWVTPSPDGYTVTMSDNKVTIRLESLSSGRSYSLHFVVAWNPYPEPHECSCWYAVDVPHKKIVQSLGETG